MTKLKLYYNNLPTSWEGETRNDFSISKERYEELLSKLKSLPKEHIKIYIQNACGLFVKELVDTYNIQGINFIEYFDNSISKKEDISTKQTSDIVVVYNIGLEKALNVDFSSRLLLGLIEETKNNNQIIIFCSHLGYTEFYKKYEIEFVNKIGIKKKQEKSIF